MDIAREALYYLCEPVPLPKNEIESYLHYFCGKGIDEPESLNITEPLRIAFYKAVTTFVRAYAAIAGDLEEAGYSNQQINELKQDVKLARSSLRT